MIHDEYTPVPGAGSPRCLVAWWGALERGGETIGDLRAVESIVRLLRSLGVVPVVASRAPYREIDGCERASWQTAAPEAFDLLAFVCGPIIGDSVAMRGLIDRFVAVRSVALGVSVLPASSPSHWNPFSASVLRDGEGGAALGDLADFARIAPRRGAPIRRIGLCLRGPQKEYGEEMSMHGGADEIARQAIAALGGGTADVVELDTRLLGDVDAAGRIESEFEEVDAVVTSRMHGALLGLAKGKPTLAIDQVRGGAKVSSVLAQAGWPAVVRCDAGQGGTRAAVEWLLGADVGAAIEASQSVMRANTDAALAESARIIRRLLSRR